MWYNPPDMRSARLLLIIALLLLVPLTGLIWISQNRPDPLVEAVVLPTRMAAAALPPVTPKPSPTGVPPILVPPTFTPPSVRAVAAAVTSPASVPGVSQPAPLTPSNDPVPAPTELAAAPPVYASNAELACPEPEPLKPEYARYVLSQEPWPSPGGSPSLSHLWLSKPLDGGGRFLTNLTFPYGSDGGNRYLLHNGVDAAGGLGAPVLSVAPGTVVVAQDDLNQRYGWRCNWYGHLVVVRLDQSWLGQEIYVLYGHVLNINVEVGQEVKRGQQLAEVGVGGAAEAAHLHLEVRIGENSYGATRNPMLWIDPASRGVIAGRLVDPLGRAWQGVGLSLIGRSADTSEGNSWSYIDDPARIVLINPDESLSENFVFADVKPGLYDVYTKVQGLEYMMPVTVNPGRVSMVEIVTEAYRAPTPPAP